MADFPISVQTLVQPAGQLVIRLTFPGGGVYEFPAPPHRTAPKRVSARHYLGGGVEVTITYDDSSVATRRIPLEELPPHEHP